MSLESLRLQSQSNRTITCTNSVIEEVPECKYNILDNTVEPPLMATSPGQRFIESPLF